MAESHIRGGSKLLKEIVRDHRNETRQHQIPAWKRQAHAYVPLESLVAIFAVLDKEAAMVRAPIVLLFNLVNKCRIDSM